MEAKYSVIIKHGLRTADYGLGIKHGLRYKTQTRLLLTEFEVRTVSYGPSFFPLIYGPSAKHAGH